MGYQHQFQVSSKQKRPSGAQARKKRRSLKGKEWDVRLTVDQDYTIDNIVQHLNENHDKILWCFIGGEELGKASQQLKEIDPHTGVPIYDYTHHHVCLIFHDEQTYDSVAKILGTKYRIGKYLTLRKVRYTYAGWIIHAMKPQTKTNPNYRIVEEWGTRPMDADNDINKYKIRSMIRKYGTSEDKKKAGIKPRQKRTAEEIEEDKKEAKKRRRIATLEKKKAELEKRLLELKND